MPYQVEMKPRDTGGNSPPAGLTGQSAPLRRARPLGMGLEAQKALLSDYGMGYLSQKGSTMQSTKDEAPEWWNTLGLLGNNPT